MCMRAFVSHSVDLSVIFLMKNDFIEHVYSPV